MTVENVSLRLTASVAGIPQLKKLEVALADLGHKQQLLQQLKLRIRAVDKRHLAQIRVDIEQRKLQIQGATKYTGSIVKEQIRLEALNATYEENIGLRRQKIIAEMMEGKGLKTKAEKQGFAILMQRESNRVTAEASNLSRMHRREILASTMAIFGMTMSIWQVTNAMSSMAGENKEARKEIMKLQGILMGATGPILLVHGVIQMLNMEMTRMTMIARTAVPVMFAIGFAYMALTTQSKKLKMAYSVMVGITAFLTTLSLAYAAANWAVAKAEVTRAAATATATGVASGGMTILRDFGIIAAGVGVASGAVTYIASMQASAQTELGQYRMMNQDANVRMHRGEKVSRPMEMWEGGGQGRGMPPVNVYIDGEIVDKTEAKIVQRHAYMGVA